MSVCGPFYIQFCLFLLLHMCSKPTRRMTSSSSPFLPSSRISRPSRLRLYPFSPTRRLIRSDVGSSRHGSLPSSFLFCLRRQPPPPAIVSFSAVRTPSPHPPKQEDTFSRSSAPIPVSQCRRAVGARGERYQPTHKNAQPIGHLWSLRE